MRGALAAQRRLWTTREGKKEKELSTFKAAPTRTHTIYESEDARQGVEREREETSFDSDGQAG
jgi:hypothetical protein